MLLSNMHTQPNPATVSGGTTITGTPGVYNGDAVVGITYPWTLINYGALRPNGVISFGVDLKAGGEVVNGANGSVVGSISGGYYGVVIEGAAGTLVNQGTISPTNGAGALLTAGGTVTNGASGATAALISGGYNGIIFEGAPGTVTNFGRIEERTTTINVQTSGIVLRQGGTVTNNGVISANNYDLHIGSHYILGGGIGVDVSGGSATITNSGSIGGGVAGVYIGGTATATVTNFGTISGHVFGIDVNTSNGVTLVNHGTIKGANFPNFNFTYVYPAFGGGAGNDWVVVYPGAEFLEGAVNGGGGNNVLELAAGAGAGTIQGLGESDSFSGFRNFGVINVDNGASWIFQSMQAANDTIDLFAAQAEFSGTVQTGHIVTFATGGATAKIDNLAQFAGRVTNFQRS